ncbi:MAG: hypothetical protein AMJ69_09380 [Gammaproteobacteria bacterium SG8_47]|nr:MAG: hypothetical protein AMJ69_09380 [Gammaproteobacteria bacterium SG8_47]
MRPAVLRRLAFVAATLLCLLIGAPAWSETQEVDPINYAFARYLGSGFYRSAGRNVWVLTLPWSTELEQPRNGAPGIEFRVATTLGFYDFAGRDIVEGELPDQVGTLSVLPGVMAHYPVTEGWTLSPFVDIGIGHNFSGGELTYIYGMGMRSDFEFSRGDYDFLLGNRLLFAGNSATDTETAGNFSSLETLLEARLPVAVSLGESQVDFSVYAANFLYSDLEVLDIANRDNAYDVQWELGFTAGVGEDTKMLGISVPRFGLGYRYSQGFYAIRLFVGRPF